MHDSVPHIILDLTLCPLLSVVPLVPLFLPFIPVMLCASQSFSSLALMDAVCDIAGWQLRHLRREAEYHVWLESFLLESLLLSLVSSPSLG